MWSASGRAVVVEEMRRALSVAAAARGGGRAPGTVLVTHRAHADVYGVLERAGLAVLRNDSPRSLAPAAVRELASRADALIAFMPDAVDAAFLDACPRLRVVAGALKGADNFDVPAMTARGVVFTRCDDLLTLPTAELALALALGLGRRVREGDALVRGGGFAGWRPALYGAGLAGATLGLVGLGAVGRALVEAAAGLRPARVLFVDPDPAAAAWAAAWSGARAAAASHAAAAAGGPRAAPAAVPVDAAPSLPALLGAADVVFPLTPLTPSTRHLLGARELAAMRRGALLVNVGRGGCVDEAAVAAALASGALGGYAADVFELEDWALADRPRRIPAALLADAGRTLFTPHVGSAVATVRREIELHAAESVIDALVRGVRPRGAVNAP